MTRWTKIFWGYFGFYFSWVRLTVAFMKIIDSGRGDHLSPRKKSKTDRRRNLRGFWRFKLWFNFHAHFRGVDLDFTGVAAHQNDRLGVLCVCAKNHQHSFT